MNDRPGWAITLRAVLDAAESPQHRFAQLATLAADGAPRCRTIVVRDLAPDGADLTFVFDARSAKTAGLLADARAELCWFLASRWQQFRLTGQVTLHGPETELGRAIWATLPPSSRALFHWPESGTPRQPDDAFPMSPPHDEPPAGYRAAVLAVTEVDQLDLNGGHHRRYVWRREPAWVQAEVRP